MTRAWASSTNSTPPWGASNCDCPSKIPWEEEREAMRGRPPGYGRLEVPKMPALGVDFGHQVARQFVRWTPVDPKTNSTPVSAHDACSSLDDTANQGTLLGVPD